MEVVKVDNLISMESERFEGTQKLSKFNVLCGFQILLDSTIWVLVIIMVCCKKLFVTGDDYIDS